MYFINIKNRLLNAITVLLAVCAVLSVIVVEKTYHDFNNNCVIYISEENTSNIIQDCFNYNEKEFILGGDNLYFMDKQTGVMVDRINNEDLIKTNDYILEVNNIGIIDEYHFSDVVNSINDEIVNFKIDRNSNIINVTMSIEELRKLEFAITKYAGNAVMTFYDPESNKFASTGHNTNFLINSDSYVTKFIYESVDKSETGTIGDLNGLSLDEKIGYAYKKCDTGIYGTITNDSFLCDSNKYKIAKKDEIKIESAKIYCDIDGNGKQWYNVEITRKQYKEDYCICKITDENLIEKTGGIISGMSGTPVVQNNKIIGAISKVKVKDPTVFYVLYAQCMVEDMYE